MWQRSKTLCFGLLAAWLATAPAMAQMAGPLPPTKPPKDPLSEGAIRLDVSMVLVNVTVTDPGDRPLTDLKKDDFQVLENDVEQEILTFSHEDAPTSIGILFDVSGSMANKIDKAVRAASQILNTANPGDEFFLVEFGSHPQLIQRFTPDISDLEMQMKLMVPKGQTALFDAISLGIEQMKNARNRRRALVIISDGGDNHSRYNETRIRSALREADCQVYTMGIFENAALQHTREERKGPALLSEFAELTGGRAFSVLSADELPKIAAKIGVELRDRYVMGYKPDGNRDGSWRSIKVKVTEPANSSPLRILAKTGYYSPKD